MLSFLAIWAYSQHFRIEKKDINRMNFDSGVMVDFDQASRASTKHTNLIEGKMQYVGKIQEIIQLNFRSFKCVVFKCKWFERFMNRRLVLHDIPSGYYAINSTRYLPQEKEPLVLPQHCSQFFFPDVLDEKMFIIDCDLRWKHVCILDENDNNGD